MIVFFALPLFTMMKSAVSDPIAANALPATASALSGWDRESPASAALQAAFVDDLKQIEDDQLFGDLVRRLNSAKSGFRTLMPKTRTAAKEAEGPLDLVAFDRRWADNGYWQAIGVAASSTITDRNLLAALDLGRDAAGEVAALPAGASANRAILLRTFSMALAVTAACVLIGLPFAMIAASVEGWKRQLLLGAVLLPFWTSLLVRTAAWFILLQDNGLINSTLMFLGLTTEPLALIFNRAGVIIAMTHVLLPFMVLPI
ncbi:MAG: ABC transporter permease, partial [Alphaproteobacteria bacterium]